VLKQQNLLNLQLASLHQHFSFAVKSTIFVPKRIRGYR
jgi:hypothetical protein